MASKEPDMIDWREHLAREREFPSPLSPVKFKLGHPESLHRLGKATGEIRLDIAAYVSQRFRSQQARSLNPGRRGVKP